MADAGVPAARTAATAVPVSAAKSAERRKGSSGSMEQVVREVRTSMAPGAGFAPSIESGTR
ncbi:hypothetical protein GCM10023176_37240 [Micromonospora coerulea]|uniref:Uncharacterized protein n=1 Tax=Micromonospora coerulea TaxID=47856 RepID=A0ABP8SS11_9ACTN